LETIDHVAGRVPESKGDLATGEPPPVSLYRFERDADVIEALKDVGADDRDLSLARSPDALDGVQGVEIARIRPRSDPAE
jgi:hypothetical protein